MFLNICSYFLNTLDLPICSFISVSYYKTCPSVFTRKIYNYGLYFIPLLGDRRESHEFFR